MSTQSIQQLSIYKFSKSNRMFVTKHSKTNPLQKTIECKTYEQSTKYSYGKMEIEI